MEFNLGANQIKMTPTQITMAGKNVSVKGQAMTSIQGGMVKINAGGGGASQAKASLEKMAVEAKVGEFDGFKGNETEKISFIEKPKKAIVENASTTNAPSESEGGFDSKDAGSLALDAMPVIGVLKGIAQVIMGKDLVTGDTIHRGAEALATVAGIVPGGKVAAKGAMKVAGKKKIGTPKPSPAEIKLAKSSGKTAEHVAARKKLSSNFYEKQGMPKAKIEGHTAGIDFTKPVEVVKLPKDKVLHQYQVPNGSQGNYYTEPGINPSSVGISSKAKDWNTGKIVERQVNPYKTKHKVEVLQSSAAKIDDTWSIPGKTIPTDGGGTQYFTMDRNGISAN